MSGYAMEWALGAAEDKALSSDATTVLVAVAYYAHPRDGMAWNANRDAIRAKTRLGAHRIIRAVAEIERSGVVPMQRRRYGIAWGPFPTLPRGGVDNSRAARPGARLTPNEPRGAPRGGRADGARVSRADGARATTKDLSTSRATHAEMAGDVDVHATVAMIKSHAQPGAVALRDGSHR